MTTETDHLLPPLTTLPFASSAIDKLALALAKAQAEFKPIVHSRTVTVKSDKGSYTFSYAELPAILDAVRPALSAHGLAVTQITRPLTGSPSLPTGATLTTLLAHESGQWMRSELQVEPKQPGAQAFGAALSYMRRYGISAILCIAADEDDDGNSADGNHIEASRQHGTPPAPPALPPAFASLAELEVFVSDTRVAYSKARSVEELDKERTSRADKLKALAGSKVPEDVDASKRLRQDYDAHRAMLDSANVTPAKRSIDAVLADPNLEIPY